MCEFNLFFGVNWNETAKQMILDFVGHFTQSSVFLFQE